jgi:hypothetical protein
MIMWTTGLLGRCLRHSLGMSSSPQAFPNFRVGIIFVRHKVRLFLWECHLRLQTELVHKPPPALHDVRHTGRVVWTDFPNSRRSHWLFHRKKCETGKTMYSGWCLWSIPFRKGIRNKPDYLRCDLTVTYFGFSLFNSLPPGHSADSLGDPVNCRFTCWVPDFIP